MGNKVPHLEMIQGVINRLAHNSFLLKGWSVTLVSALFALAASSSQVYFVFAAFLPSVMLWGLDGYFLRQERLFRKLYDHVRVLPDEEIDFSMDTRSVSDQVAGWFRVTWSKTLRSFHGVIVVSLVAVILIALCLAK